MKSNSILCNALMLAAPMALFLQGSALAQTKAETNPPPSAQAPEARAHANALAFWTNVDFYFVGGGPAEFLREVDKQYKVDWSRVADIPSEMVNVHIPKLRLSRESVERILPSFRGGIGRGGGGGAGGGVWGKVEERNPLDALVALYNNMSQARPELGNLVVEGDPAKPSIVIFRATYPRATPDLKLKAFALRGIPQVEWEKLREEVNNQFALLTRLNDAEANPPKIVVALNADSGLLIVLAPESYVAAAESLVAAWRANQPAPLPPSGTSQAK